MNDHQVSNPTVTSSTPPGGTSSPAGKNPLDALEELLKDAKAKSDQKKIDQTPLSNIQAANSNLPGGMAAMTGAEAQNLTQAQNENIDSEAEMKQVQELEEKQKKSDESQLKQHLKDMKQVIQVSPQTQVRDQQNHDKKIEEQDKQQVEEDYKIRQLGHQKI